MAYRTAPLLVTLNEGHFCCLKSLSPVPQKMSTICLHMNWKARVACNFSRLFENEAVLKVTCPHWNSTRSQIFGIRKIRMSGLSYGVVFVIMCLAILVQYWTDRQTDDHSVCCISIALCGKNKMMCVIFATPDMYSSDRCKYVTGKL